VATQLSDQDPRRVLQLVADHEQEIRDGTNTSTAEVTNISKHGFWLALDGRELFLS
jgi:hypothetical protein